MIKLTQDNVVSQNVSVVPANKELLVSFSEYARYVVQDRALPDIRDGLKPVQRRILYAMNDLKLKHDARYTKVAKVVGECMGNYHPHGDASIASALVRLGQDWVMRYPLIDGMGNWGNIDGDDAAAPRYIECRLTKLGEDYLEKPSLSCVAYDANYDGTRQEPQVLPVPVPALLLNGSSGIAVGMSTSILPNNMTEVISATIALIDNPTMKDTTFLEYLPGPDFPTGGSVHNSRDAYLTGNGTITVEGKVEIAKEGLIITEIPYNTTKSSLVTRIAELVDSQKFQYITGVLDHSDKDGLCILIEIDKQKHAPQAREELLSLTPVRSCISINMVALINGSPESVTPRRVVEEWLKFRKDVVQQRLLDEKYQLQQKCIQWSAELYFIKNAKTLVDMFLVSDEEQIQGKIPELSADQIKHLLAMPVRRLLKKDASKTQEEHDNAMSRIEAIEAIILSETGVSQLIRSELLALKATCRSAKDKRRTAIWLK